MAKTNKSKISTRSIKARVLILLVFLLLLYIVLPQIDSFAESFAVLKEASLQLVALAFLLVVASYFVAGATYLLLAVRKLRFGRTVLIQGASAFANRILPAGLGGLTLNVEYLRKQRHTLPQAIAVAGTNNTLGFIGHLCILAVLVLTTDEPLTGTVRLPYEPLVWGVAVAGVLIAIVLVLAPGLRASLLRLLAGIGKQFVSYRKRPLRLFTALGTSMGVTLISVAVFYLSSHAVGVPLTALQALLVFTVGVLVGTVTPTPGGLGGVEAGLVAGSLAYGYGASLALAAALLYRLLTYWLPLLPGFALFMFGRKYYL